MLRHVMLSFALAAGLLVTPSPAVAGRWATTTLDTVPDQVRAGETYRIGYTILQHGVTPFASRATAVRIRSSATGADQAFPAQQDGPVGHYVAQVRFPAAGTWTWEITHEFGGQRLAPLTVAAAEGTSVTAAAAVDAAGIGRAVATIDRATTGITRAILPAITWLAAGLFAVQLILAFAGRRQRPVPVQPAGSSLGAPR
jgi:hypothetical protein